METQIDGRITVKAGSRVRKESRKKEQRCDKVRAKKGCRWDRVGVHRGRNGRIRANFLRQDREDPQKKDRPDGVRARRNLQLYRKKGAMSGQTASWPVNNIAK